MKRMRKMRIKKALKVKRRDKSIRTQNKNMTDKN